MKRFIFESHCKSVSISSAVAVTLVGLTTAPPAFGKAPVEVVAPAPAEVVTRHISYADLNLASLAGERALNGRVRVAVRSLCDEATGGDNDGRMTSKFAMGRCGTSAWNQARPQISLAVQRARDIASTGMSSIAAVAITVGLPE